MDQFAKIAVEKKQNFEKLFFVSNWKVSPWLQLVRVKSILALLFSRYESLYI